jgi:hypothetical protein
MLRGNSKVGVVKRRRVYHVQAGLSRVAAAERVGARVVGGGGGWKYNGARGECAIARGATRAPTAGAFDDKDARADSTPAARTFHPIATRSLTNLDLGNSSANNNTPPRARASPKRRPRPESSLTRKRKTMAAFAAPPGHPAHNQIMALCAMVDAPVAIKAPDAGLKVRSRRSSFSGRRRPVSLSLSLSRARARASLTRRSPPPTIPSRPDRSPR